MMVFTFCFRLEIPVLSKFGPKNKNCEFKPNFGTKTKFKYSKLNGDIHFLCFRPNLVQKIKIVNLS